MHLLRGEDFGSEGQNGVETQDEGVFIGAAAPVPLVVALDVSKAVCCIKKHPQVALRKAAQAARAEHSISTTEQPSLLR